jgi:hypothetical protein
VAAGETVAAAGTMVDEVILIQEGEVALHDCNVYSTAATGSITPQSNSMAGSGRRASIAGEQVSSSVSGKGLPPRAPLLTRSISK